MKSLLWNPVVVLGVGPTLLAASMPAFAGARLSSDPPGSCVRPTVTAALAAAAPGDTVFVEPGTYSGAEIASLAIDLTITASDPSCTTPVPRGGVVFDYTGVGPTTVGAGATVRLDSLVLENGAVAGSGGLVVAAGNVVISDSLLHDSTASNTGACVFVGSAGSAVVEDGSELDNCQAGLHGGGIYSAGGDVTVTSSTIRGSGAVLDGGGIHMAIAGGGVLTLEDAELRDNSADRGGAVYAQGQVFVRGASRIETNSAVDGGGIYGLTMALTVDGTSRLSDNTATGDGAGIYATSLATNPGSVLIAGNAQILDNHATGNGGGLYVQGADTTLTLTDDVRLRGNYATNGGGAYHSSQLLTVQGDVEIRENTATVSGGGLLVSGTAATAHTIEGTVEFRDNRAENGAGLALVDTVLHFHDNALLFTNIASATGGAIAAQDAHVVLHDDVVVEWNRAELFGGALYGVDSVFTLDDQATVRHNEAVVFYGGGVFVEGGGHVTTVGTVSVFDNTAGAEGGGVYARDAYFYQGPNARLESNQAKFGGGAFLTGASSSSNTILGTVIRNIASFEGGGITLRRDDAMASLHMANTTVLERNVANCRGGGLMLLKGIAELEGATVTGNVTTGSGQSVCPGEGGGAFVDGEATLWARGTTFQSNTARHGGGLFLQGDSAGAIANVSLENTSVMGNTAILTGGGIEVEQFSALDMRADFMFCNPGALPADTYCSQVVGNNAGATNAGGGLRIEADTAQVLVSNTAFRLNNAARGAAIHQNRGDSTFVSCLVARNGLGTNAIEAVRVRAGRMQIENSTLADNPRALTMINSTSPSPSDVTVRESIVWANGAPDIVWTGTAGPDSMFLTSSIIQGTLPASATTSGIVAANPQFVTTARGDYHLAATSPAVDAMPAFSLEDLDGTPHTLGAGLDLGAFEDF
ncbi:MAG: hypothetical protein AAF602_13910 [Myxococcota bacterium]